MKKYFLFLLLTICSSHFTRAQTPNILLVIADDLGRDALNSFGQSTLMPTTPTMDSLRAIGIAFDNVWGTPTCTSTRASMMSGLHGNKTGVQGTPGNLDTAYTSVLKRITQSQNADYAKSVIGKWHISSKPVDPDHPIKTGADYYVGFLEAFPTTYDVWDKTENGVTAEENSYVTTTLTDKAIVWTQAQTKPWFLWLAHAAPHTPFHVPPSHMYTITSTNNNLQKFIAMIESLDYEINRLLASMSTEERDNTLVIFLGDNGTGGQVLRDYPAGHGKGTIYEGGIGVPMIIAGKGVTRKGERESALINLTDVHATILDIADVPMNGGVGNSLSFKHLLTGNAGNTRDYNFMEFKDGLDYYWSVCNAQYKLIQLADGSKELYDLTIDPFENSPINMTSLSAEVQAIVDDLEDESETTRNSWSCRDYIQNGDEIGIDCGGSNCSPCTNSITAKISNTIHIYPNPSKGNLVIKANEPILVIHIYNSIGQQVYERNMSSNTVAIDISLLNAELYHIEIVTSSSSTYKSILKL
jgi:arylsulfatase B